MANLLASFQAGYIADLVCAAHINHLRFRGPQKGFVKSFFGLVSTLAALILAFALASTVLGWIDSAFGMTEFFRGKFETSFLKIKGFDTDISATGINAALESVNLPGFIKDVLAKKLAR